MAEFYFDLTPFEALNDSQKAAIADPSAIALSGGPGTGKSVVSLWRHIINHTRENPIDSQLLTHTTSLAYYLKKCCEPRSSKASLSVDSSLNWFYNNRTNKAEIIIDEAQDMSVEFNKSLMSNATSITYGADNQQILKSNSFVNGIYNHEVCSPEEELIKIFTNNQPHRLNKNYRSTQRIMLFAKEFFQESFVPSEIIEGLANKVGDYPRLIITNGDLAKKNIAIRDIIRQYNQDDTTNIAILQPFDKPPYGKEHCTAKYYYDLLNGDFDCSYYGHTEYNNGGLSEIKTIHCTPFKSSKGLEFDVVIIPNMHLAHEQFKVIDWRDFFVGVTRAKSQLIMFSDVEIPQINNLVETIKL